MLNKRLIHFKVVREAPNLSYQEDESHRFIAFHFHVNHLANRNGVYRPGVVAVVVFHAQRYINGYRYARVNGRDRAAYNRRTPIVECTPDLLPDPNWQYWYPGEVPNSATSDLPLWAVQLTRFGDYLFDEDLLTEATFTAANRGQLGTYTDDKSECPVQYFDWGGYT
jgi:chitinase